jgi:hypothetical protein
MRRTVLLVVGGLIIGATVATMTTNTTASGGGNRFGALHPGSVIDRSALCRPDRRINLTRAVVKVYKDPVGDRLAGHGDITGVRISDIRGVVTFTINVTNLRNDYLVTSFYTNCDPNGNHYVLSVWRGGVELERVNEHDEIFPMPPASISRSGNTITFRFSSSRFGRTTAFLFEAHLDTPQTATVSDWAPDHDYWYYDLLSR